MRFRLSVIGVFVSLNVFAQTVKNQFIVKMQNSAKVYSFSENATVRSFSSLPKWVVIKSEENDFQEWLKDNEDEVQYWEPAYALFAIKEQIEDEANLGASALEFKDQWALSSPQDTDVDIESAWEVTKGKPSTLVAVIDTGMDSTHADLAATLWKNPKEIPGNKIDDDNNGLIDDVSGWNFEANTPIAEDDNGHGSHVSGIIAAQGKRLYGVAPQIKILPLKFLDKGGSGSTSDAIAAIDYAVKMGAKVLNNSWGGTDYSVALEEAVKLAESRGIVFVAAAGNNGTNLDQFKMYPASYQVSNMIVVGNIEESGKLHTSSNFSASQVHIAAPGTAIWSTYARQGYAKLTGTSMAAPFVSGAAALLLSVKPGLKPFEVRKILQDTARRMPLLNNKIAQSGILKIGAALKSVDGDPEEPSPPSDEFDLSRVTFSKEVLKKWYQVDHRVKVQIKMNDETLSHVNLITYTYKTPARWVTEAVQDLGKSISFTIKTKTPAEFIKIRVQTKDQKNYYKNL